MIRKAEHRDVRDIVRVHQEAFPEFFMTQLGARVLHLYYSEAIQWPGACTLVATDGNEVLGFAVGIVALDDYNHYLIRHRFLRLAINALPQFILHPSLLIRAWWSITRPKEELEEEKSHEASITSIAVSNRKQRLGFGKLLLAELVKRLQERGAAQITLSTDMENNERANMFYASAGFHLHHSYTTWKGRRMNEYALRVEEQTTNTALLQ
jgi:ribosomal protein S18 acetylase RimI-like enzyme